MSWQSSASSSSSSAEASSAVDPATSTNNTTSSVIPSNASSTSSNSSTIDEDEDSSSHSSNFLDSVRESRMGNQCVNCQEDVTSMGIECVVCTNVRLCMECFSCYAEVGDHTPDHKYRFFHSGRCKPIKKAAPQTSQPASIISTRAAANEGTVWYEEEQIRLLKGLELYGYGNWGEIANYITTKTAQEAKEEYTNRFINGTLGQMFWSEEKMEERDSEVPFPIDHTVKHMVPPAGTSCAENGNMKVGPLSPSLTSKLPPLEITREEARLLGCMPKRDEYEIDHDNEAEKLICDMSIDEDDTELDISLKLAVVDIYVQKVRERARRRKMVRDYQLVAKFFKERKQQQQQQAAQEEPRPSTSAAALAPPPPQLQTEAPKPEWPCPPEVSPREHLDQYRKYIEKMLRPFAQFHTRRDFDTLVNNFVMERNLQFRINELKKYRMMGMTKFSEVEQYERQQQMKRTQEEKQRKKGLLLVAVQENEDDEAEEEEEDEESGGDDPDEEEDDGVRDPDFEATGEEEEEVEEEELDGETADDTDLSLSFVESGDSPESSGSTEMSGESRHQLRGYLTERRRRRVCARPKRESGRMLTRHQEEAQKKKRRKPRNKRLHHRKSHTASALETARQAKMRKAKEKEEEAKGAAARTSKRRRGRPRKYEEEEETSSASAETSSASAETSSASAETSSASAETSSVSAETSSASADTSFSSTPEESSSASPSPPAKKTRKVSLAVGKRQQYGRGLRRSTR